MGFSGGGSNVLKPHTHDSTILQDGGNLNFQNITQSNMSNGSLTYSDGNHLQELGIGAADDLLTVSGGVPTWSSHGDYPVVKLLASYTVTGGGVSNVNLAITPAIDLETDYSEIIVITNLYTTSSVGGYGDVYMNPNGWGGTFTNPYGYSITPTPAITAQVIAATNRHALANPAMTTINSSLYCETHFALAKSATTTETIYLRTDSIADQNISEHWQNSTDLGTTTLSSVQVASSGTWGLGSNFAIYGLKYN